MGRTAQKLIDHLRIFPYLLELMGPHVRLDHDYAIFMEQGTSRSRLHGGPDVVGDHWYKYRDGVIRNGLSVMTYALADVNEGNGGFACIPGSHKTNFLRSVPKEVRQFDRDPHYVKQPAMKAEDVLFSPRPWFTAPSLGPYRMNVDLSCTNIVLATRPGTLTTLISANTMI